MFRGKRTFCSIMGVVNTILSVINLCILLVIVYYIDQYVKADWCSWEIEKGIFLLEDILNKIESK